MSTNDTSTSEGLRGLGKEPPTPELSSYETPEGGSIGEGSYKSIARGDSVDADLDIPEVRTNRHLWLGNVQPTKVTKAALEGVYAKFGPLESVRAFTGKTYAFVNFVHQEHAVTAKHDTEGVCLPELSSGKPLIVKFQKEAQSTASKPDPSDVGVSPTCSSPPPTQFNAWETRAMG